jgi:ABC-type transport system substrate-binding protein
MAPTPRRLLNASRVKPALSVCFLAVLFLACLWPVDGILAAATKENIVRIGIPDEPRTLNLWLASDANSRQILRQIYEPLYERDPDTLTFVPWLAADLPAYDAEKIAYTVPLRKAFWSDGRPVTSADVAFTAKIIQEFKLPGLSSRWTNVERIETPDPSTVVFYLKKPSATFLSRTLEAAIVPAHQWAPIAQQARQSDKPLAALLNHPVGELIGTGPFTLKQWRQGAYIYMVRNPRFFGTGLTIAGRSLGPHVDGLLYKIFATADVAMLSLRQGGIDFFLQHVQPGYIEVLRGHPQIHIYANKKSALYYMGLNTRRPPFNDLAMRRAVATLVDKDFIVTRLLQGMGTKMHSVIPPGNQPWCNMNVPRHGDGLSREERIRAAHTLLAAAGYSWETAPVNEQGDIVPGRGIRRPDGQPIPPFTILTPPADYDPARAISGTIIQQWLREIGLPASARPMEFGSLLQQVRTRQDFDAFILGYGRLSLDPDYLCTFFTAANDKPRGYNMSGYNNKKFDALASRTRTEMDPEARMRIVHEMQALLMADVPYIPLYLPDLLEAVRTDRFAGWVPMLDGIANRWSFTQLKPISAKGRP